MSIGKRLSHSLDCRDQGPNKEVAKEIINTESTGLLQELIDLLESKPNEGLRKDCALTLAYVAEKKPALLVPYADLMISRMNDPINRVIFSCMIALAHITPFVQDKLYHALPVILDAMDDGTVVTRDYGFRIIVELYKIASKKEDIFYIILEQVSKAPSNQLGQYTERFLAVVDNHHKSDFISVLEERRSDLTNEYHLKRLSKNLKKLYK